MFHQKLHTIFIFAVLLFSSIHGLFGQANLRSGDKVLISISGVSIEEQNQVNREYMIDEDGMLNLPYIPMVSAVDKSPSELQRAIESSYVSNEIYTNPTITVGIQENARFVDVIGAVKSPTRVPYTEDLTLMSAISATGGFTPYANRKAVTIRRGKDVQVINTKDINKGKVPDVPLRPGDKIEVVESWL